MGALTTRDYRRTPDGPPWFQLVEGCLLKEPSPRRDHQDASHELGYALSTYLRKHPLGLIFFAPFDVYLDEANVFQPDILIVRNEHAARVTDRGVFGAPDFVVEILSPSNRRLDLGRKKSIYAQTGVGELWIVDPKAKSVTAYDLATDANTPAHRWTNAEGPNLTSRQFPRLAIPVNTLFLQR